MQFSHISDTHLGLVQYGSEERAQDVYDVFNQAIDTSIKDHVDFVIFAGDIFHVPNPNGTAIVQMANGLKRLKQNNIDSFFILGEHDISRIRTTPIPYVYHNLEFSKYIGQGKPIEYKGVLLAGFDKIRKTEISQYEEKFAEVDKIAQSFSGHKILVLHQGITEFNKFAGELQSTELPKNFTYYAMGHLHDTDIKKFNHLNGPIAYPGSIEMTTSEGIKETKKGFFEVDISGQEANPNWIELETRPQFSFKTDYQELSKTIDEISEKIAEISKKPIVEVNIQGEKIETDYIQAQIARLNSMVLRCFWRISAKQVSDSSVFLDRPNIIDDEMYRLSVDALGSEQAANLAIKELLPVLSSRQIQEASQIIIENFEKFKKEKKQ
ncbi:DNA double-strand break repair protein Mre11 [Marine Group I thaumarchaeote SCGC RSA3]|uniref:DNA double-strand break repair protein Mre11 n=2 Tax=Marine Group I TaxID=905826 RepID=A0A087RQA1_9ARCH|nr:DNA double-strand break repair protein Mre11 [Marine Group I thaumarchaeote SCGC AAA799-D11]KFM17101.1 DNA double-strand break repair protein Mre11 [Marine Group I thaumarchaeote SCGC RSA3]